ncbi:hypothetical protein [Variovorax sp. OV700]|uniref:hypothetical protein n=1 Tax=Variovorax sp. OV700 TaxID=1882826 RepID=UPI0011146540|nr:hypothetical protein [Variovorax sp. OV700]
MLQFIDEQHPDVDAVWFMQLARKSVFGEVHLIKVEDSYWAYVHSMPRTVMVRVAQASQHLHRTALGGLRVIRCEQLRRDVGAFLSTSNVVRRLLVQPKVLLLHEEVGNVYRHQ